MKKRLDNTGKPDILDDSSLNHLLKYRVNGMAQTKKKTGLADIAKLAGVSSAAVGKVLNGGGASIRVGAATRERILNAAKELHYRPSMAASILAGGSSRLVGLIFGCHGTYRNEKLIASLDQSAVERNYSLISGYTDYDPEKFRKVLNTYLAYDVESIIVIGGTDLPELGICPAQLSPITDRLVFFWKPDLKTDCYLETDLLGAMKEFIGDAHRRGFRRLGLLTGNTKYREERCRGTTYLEAHRMLDLPAEESLICPMLGSEIDPFPAEFEEKLMDYIRAAKPDHLFIDDAYNALHVHFLLHKNGIDMPIQGGNDDPVFRTAVPVIPSFDPCYPEIADSLLDMALKRKNGPVTVKTHYIRNT